MPYTSTRKKIAATAVAIDACDQKITPQLRRKTMQWLRRRSEPCELRAALFLAPWLLLQYPKAIREETRFLLWLALFSDKNEKK
jgi:hypothetical protein